VSEGQLADLLRYRIAEAHETLREAQVLLDAEALRGATNRAYYAMFYAVLALLATKGLGTSKHGGGHRLVRSRVRQDGSLPTGHVAFTAHRVRLAPDARLRRTGLQPRPRYGRGPCR
jgi:uncharacterized protein (UPF0332 family)